MHRYVFLFFYLPIFQLLLGDLKMGNILILDSDVGVSEFGYM